MAPENIFILLILIAAVLEAVGTTAILRLRFPWALAAALAGRMLSLAAAVHLVTRAGTPVLAFLTAVQPELPDLRAAAQVLIIKTVLDMAVTAALTFVPALLRDGKPRFAFMRAPALRILAAAAVTLYAEIIPVVIAGVGFYFLLLEKIMGS